jgi:antimicrobial peptide system SdpB family protein
VPEVTEFWRSLLRTATWFEPRGRALALGRLLLATATLTIVVFTPDAVLFTDATSRSAGIQWGGVRSASLWCLSGELTGSYAVARFATIAVLLLIATGYRPRWTCVPHWYVTFSLASSMAAINGGDNAAVIATMLAVPLCLGDERRWQWARPTRPLSAAWRGRSYATQLVVRLQVFFIYIVAASTKLLDPAWRDGSALYFALQDPTYGLPASALDAVAPVLTSRWLIALATWAVIAVQVVIAMAVLGRRRERLLAVVLVTGLHLGIIVLMGLTSFGLVMIAFALVALGGPARDKSLENGQETDVAADSERQPV